MAVDETHGVLLDEARSTGTLGIEVGSVAPLGAGALGPAVADAAAKSLVSDKAGRPLGVLIVANSVDPNSMARSVDKASEAKRILGAKLGAVVLVPLASGEFRGRSYVLWPWWRPVSGARWLRFAQRTLLRPKVFAWLRAVAEHTKAETENERFVAPLKAVVDDARLPSKMREMARSGLDRLAAGAWTPWTVLEHKDVWLGNILLPPNREARRLNPNKFVLIDWGGMADRGYAFLDLLYFSQSVSLPARQLRREVDALCRVLGCEHRDAVSYLLAGLGAIGMDLGHFPEDRYVRMSAEVFGHLTRALGDNGGR